MSRNFNYGAPPRIPSLRSEDANSPNPPSRKTEVVSKQATKVTALSTKLEWKIDQFDKLMKLFKNGQNLVSRQFFVPQAPTVVWELHVYPNGKREEDLNNVSFFLRQVGLARGEEPIMTEFQIYALDSNNGRVSVCRDTKDFTNQQGRGKFQVSRDKMVTALRSDGSLLLICEVEYFPPGSKISVEPMEDTDANDMKDEKPGIAVDMSAMNLDMFENERFTDCIIKVGTQEIKCHKGILSQLSPVFNSMFLNEMLEARDGIINITDYKYETVFALVKFMYTGSAEEIDTQIDQLLAIADKYEVLQLKEHCERVISCTLNQKNITQIATFADTYAASHLKQAVIRYLSRNHKNIIRTPEWKAMKKDRYELANELLEAILSFGNDDDDDLSSSRMSLSPARKRARRSENLSQSVSEAIRAAIGKEVDRRV